MDTGSVQGILDEASRQTGLDDFGDDWFLAPLAAWVNDLAQDNLTDFGRRFLRSLAVRDVARRLRVIATLDAHPEIAEVALPPILYITGLERSGTTLLHNLLATHRHGRSLLRWELMEPLPPPQTATFDTDPRIEMVQQSVDKLRGSLLERMHWVNADEPEECVWGFIDGVSMLGGAAGLCMPAWADFLALEDQRRSYENYRRVVQLLLWKHPVEPGGFLVLKAPQIGRHIDSFATVFPEARFVITDRDPFRCIVSMAAMGESIVDPFCVNNPMTDDGVRGRVIQAGVEPKLAALHAFTDTSKEGPTHVAYPALVSDPSAVVSDVFGAADIAFDDDDAAGIDAFLDAQRAGRRSSPPAELATMGYEHDQVLASAPIRSYCDRFAIEPERTRLTGA
ncbi:MAG: sulfotransferase [Acidimicrobiales bacterium]